MVVSSRLRDALYELLILQVGAWLHFFYQGRWFYQRLTMAIWFTHPADLYPMNLFRGSLDVRVFYPKHLMMLHSIHLILRAIGQVQKFIHHTLNNISLPFSCCLLN
jgi:hypothetical protein